MAKFCALAKRVGRACAAGFRAFAADLRSDV